MGQIFGGIVTLAGGVTGEVLGGAVTVTGIGAVLGVPAIVVSTTLVVGGAGNIAAGVRALMTTGSGSSGPKATPPAAGEARTPRTASQAQREASLERSGLGPVTPSTSSRGPVAGSVPGSASFRLVREKRAAAVCLIEHVCWTGALLVLASWPKP